MEKKLLVPVRKSKLLVQYPKVKFCPAMWKTHSDSPIFVLAEKQNSKNKHKK